MMESEAWSKIARGIFGPANAFLRSKGESKKANKLGD
jgi:hypothetical protein